MWLPYQLGLWTSNTLMKLNASHIGSIHMLEVHYSYFLLNTHVISERGIHKMILYVHSNEQCTGSVILRKLKLCFFLLLPLESSLNVYSWQGFHCFLKFPGFYSWFFLLITSITQWIYSPNNPCEIQKYHLLSLFHVMWNEDKGNQL